MSCHCCPSSSIAAAAPGTAIILRLVSDEAQPTDMLRARADGTNSHGVLIFALTVHSCSLTVSVTASSPSKASMNNYEF